MNNVGINVIFHQEIKKENKELSLVGFINRYCSIVLCNSTEKSKLRRTSHEGFYYQAGKNV